MVKFPVDQLHHLVVISFLLFLHYITAYYSLRNQLIGLVGRVLANGPGNRGSIPGGVIPKTLKMVLDNSLLNTQQYKVRIKSKVEQSKERSSALPYTIEKGAFWSPSTTIANFTLLTPCEFFPLALADSLLLNSKWQQISLSLQDSSRYSSRSQ